MAAIDPDETPELEDGIDPSKPRATLKLIRPPPGMNIEESDEEEDWEDDDEEDSDEEESNGGPSDKEKARKLKEAAALKEMEEDEDEDDDEEDDDDDDDDEDFDLKAAISKLVKGKGPATDDDDEDDEDDESLDVDEAVICTLDPEKVRLALTRSLHRHGKLTELFSCSTTSKLLTSLSPRASPFSSRSPVLTVST